MKKLKNSLQQLQQIIFVICKLFIVSIIYFIFCCMLPFFKRCFATYNSLQQHTTATSLQHFFKRYLIDILVVAYMLCVVCYFVILFKTINSYGYK